jgi:hypothetical protein
LAAIAMLLLIAQSAPAQSSNSSKQVVFSGGGVFSYTVANPPDKHFGFWIWCEGESTNPYHGQCSGAMYFYSLLAATKHVAGGVTELSEGVYQMTVASTIDDSVSCTLTNAAPPTHGPSNTVTVLCTAPEGTGSSTNAVVNVTGK